jgi:peptidoglycan/LPS O-acetylase OafA/YrhL
MPGATVQSEPGRFRQTPRLHVLDAFRALAITAVLICHYFASWGLPEYPGNLYGYRHSYPLWLGWGALGVEFFFVISGFVIFMTLEKCGSLVEFWLRRFARLYPAYVAAMLLTFSVTNMVGPKEFASSPVDFLIGLGFATSFVRGAKFVDQVYWSLAVELLFYIVIGLAYVAAGKRFVAVWTLYVATSLACWLAGKDLGSHVLVSLAERIFLLPYLAHFTLGIAFFFLYSGRVSGWRALALVALLTYTVVARRAPLAWHAAHALMLVLFALFIWGKLGWLAIRPLRFLGEISYSLYLVHAYIGIILIGLLTRQLAAPDLVAALAATLLCVGLAYGLTKTVERPVQRAVLNWARPHLCRVASRFPSLTFAANVPAGVALPRARGAH